MGRRPGWIRQFHQPASPESLPLLVFPHAGAGASAYRTFSKVLSSRFDVIVFQYPGRQDRAAEALLDSLHAMADGAFREFVTSGQNRGVPIVAFGHSMGALIAFEFVRLAEASGITVRQLNASSAIAPCRVADKMPHPTDDREILDHLRALAGTDADVVADPDLMKLTLPVIKADYRAFDAYSCADNTTIAAPIHVLAADQDPVVTLGDLYGWGEHTDTVELTMFDGGHFYLHDHLDALGQLLASCAHREPTA